MELRGVASLADDVSLGEFLEQVSLVSDVDNLEEEQSAPTLLTLHSAKGLEFPVVFITGLEEGVLPHSRSLDDMEELAEERRLFYVGLTRAKDRIYLLHTFRRTVWGESSVSSPSRFLGDIPVDLTTGSSPGQRREATVRKASSWEWGRERSHRTPSYNSRGDDGRVYSRPRRSSGAAEEEPAAEKSADDEPAYRSGQKVRHPKFGDGIVVESRVTGSIEEVTVAFKQAGIKKLAVDFANLEIIG